MTNISRSRIRAWLGECPLKEDNCGRHIAFRLLAATVAADQQPPEVPSLQSQHFLAKWGDHYAAWKECRSNSGGCPGLWICPFRVQVDWFIKLVYLRLLGGRCLILGFSR
ncbi:unnamed protein product [Polarella glacialis]|uniref:Uncharacterized protein n=1 Tax=Polarella glacialis TaxID=89957 RepID=A0A813FIT8_POLGL|nr:unnamed protein product [Polarella glacialis]